MNTVFVRAILKPGMFGNERSVCFTFCQDTHFVQEHNLDLENSAVRGIVVDSEELDDSGPVLIQMQYADGGYFYLKVPKDQLL